MRRTGCGVLLTTTIVLSAANPAGAQLGDILCALGLCPDTAPPTTKPLPPPTTLPLPTTTVAPPPVAVPSAPAGVVPRIVRDVPPPSTAAVPTTEVPTLSAPLVRVSPPTPRPSPISTTRAREDHDAGVAGAKAVSDSADRSYGRWIILIGVVMFAMGLVFVLIRRHALLAEYDDDLESSTD